MHKISDETHRRDFKSFGIILRGSPEDFLQLTELAKAAGLFIVFTKTSYLKLMISEAPF
jgi:hypothetical protein